MPTLARHGVRSDLGEVIASGEIRIAGVGPGGAQILRRRGGFNPADVQAWCRICRGGVRCVEADSRSLRFYSGARLALEWPRRSRDDRSNSTMHVTHTVDMDGTAVFGAPPSPSWRKCNRRFVRETASLARATRISTAASLANPQQAAGGARRISLCR